MRYVSENPPTRLSPTRVSRALAGAAAVMLIAAGAAAAPAAAHPVDPYIDTYGAEICDALNHHPDHAAVVRAVVAVRDYVHLSDEDATLVVADSVAVLCPQYRGLVYQSG